ncbi:hypothetical protein [Metabacillus fastidiosus]|uniref:hypothetical protein n=1 Tax=Metabacillus fastidiosus TaxID=1458 RepID=UPI003D2C7669
MYYTVRVGDCEKSYEGKPEDIITILKAEEELNPPIRLGAKHGTFTPINSFIGPNERIIPLKPLKAGAPYSRCQPPCKSEDEGFEVVRQGSSGFSGIIAIDFQKSGVPKEIIDKLDDLSKELTQVFNAVYDNFVKRHSSVPHKEGIAYGDAQLSLNDVVYHEKYGVGKIVRSDNQEKSSLVVVFDNAEFGSHYIDFNFISPSDLKILHSI